MIVPAKMRAAAILVAALAGLRTGELRALRWRDIGWADGTRASWFISTAASVAAAA